MSLAAGTRLGAHEIVGVIGAGGMGEVYRARDTKLDRDVALKILPEVFATDPDRVARFTREAQTLAALNHPNIAAIYGIEEGVRTSFGSAGAQTDPKSVPTPFRALVMELVEGRDLSEVIAGGPLPLAEALPIARQIAEALEAAHESGIIHRDLKPANVKVREDGTVKVLDFGLAKAVDPASDPSSDMMNSPTLTARATQMGMILGTAAYMAPEQAKGKRVDRRADVWAFGAVLFEMLTGRRAFEGSDVSDTLASVLAREPDWAAVPPGTPAPIVKLLRQCLEKDRKERTPDIAVARFAIREALAPGDATPARSAAPTAPLWRQPLLWVTAAAVALVAAASTWWFARPVPEAARVGRFTFTLPAAPGNPTNRVLAISPLGTEIAFVADKQLWLRRLGDLEPTLLTPNEHDVRAPFFSPDGQQVGFVLGQRIKRVSISGGSPVDVGGPVPLRPFGVEWADDGHIYVGVDEGIARLPATGGQPQLVIKAESGERLSSATLLRGGEWLLFVASKGNPTDGQVVAESVTTHERRVLAERGQAPRTLPTGHLVYYLDGSLFGQAFDDRRIAVTGGPVSLVDGISNTSGRFTRDVNYDLSRRGDLVYVPGLATAGAARLALVDRPGTRTLLPADPGTFGAVRLSPDGRRIAAAAPDGGGGDIWLYDVDRPGRQRLTSDGRSFNPVWSPDSEWVYYSSFGQDDQANARLGVWRRRADLSGERDQVFAMPEADVFPYSMSADGKRISLEVHQGDQSPSRVAVLDLEGTAQPVLLTSDGRANSREPYLSPDGRFVAYASDESGPAEIYVQEVSTGRKRLISTSSATHPRWTRDGKEIIFPDRGSRTLSVVRVLSLDRLEFSPPEMLVERPYLSTAYDVSTDSTRLLVPVPEDGGAAQARQVEITVVLDWFEELRTKMPVR